MIRKSFAIFCILLILMIPFSFADKNQTMKRGQGAAAVGAGVLLGSYLLSGGQIFLLGDLISKKTTSCWVAKAEKWKTGIALTQKANAEAKAADAAFVTAVESAYTTAATACKGCCATDPPKPIPAIPHEEVTDPIGSSPIPTINVRPKKTYSMITPDCLPDKFRPFFPLPSPDPTCSVSSSQLETINKAYAEAMASAIGTCDGVRSDAIKDVLEGIFIKQEAALMVDSSCYPLSIIGWGILAAGAGTMAYAMNMQDESTSHSRREHDGDGHAGSESSQAGEYCSTC